MKYTKKCTDSKLFGPCTTYYKDGVEIARKGYGKPLQWVRPYTEPVVISRSQAYRYWRKYFPRRRCFDLPEVLAYATIRLDNVNPDMVDGVWFDGKECHLHYYR